MPYTQDQLKRLNLKTGDILLFSCNSLGGTIVQLACKSKWSHLGMVVIAENGNIEFFESSLNLGRVLGVQITPLDTTLNQTFVVDNAKEIAIRRLKQPLSAAQTDALTVFIKQNLGANYEANPLEFIKAAFIGPGTREEILQKALPNSVSQLLAGNSGFARLVSVSITLATMQTFTQENLNTIFCSELMAAALQDVGLLPRQLQGNSFAPSDFSAGGRDAELRDDDIFLAEEALPAPESPINGMTVMFDLAKDAADKLAAEAAAAAEALRRGAAPQSAAGAIGAAGAPQGSTEPAKGGTNPSTVPAGGCCKIA